MTSSDSKPAATTKKQSFSVAIATPSYQEFINNTLKDPERAKRFIASVTSAVAITPALQSCTPITILSAGLTGEALNLSPSPQLGQYYFVPFKQKAKYDKAGNLISPECVNAQFVLGYKGYIQLALRSGQYADLDCMEIREGEYLGKDPATAKPRFKFVENDELRESLPIIGYMAYFEYLNGFRKCLYWSKEKMLKHADQYSQAFSAEAYQQIQNGEIADKDMWKYSSFWYKDFDGMAKKTLLRQLIGKWGIMSTEMQCAMVSDTSILSVDKETGEIITEPANGTEVAAEAPENVIDAPPPESNAEESQIDLNDL